MAISRTPIVIRVPKYKEVDIIFLTSLYQYLIPVFAIMAGMLDVLELKHIRH